MSQAPRHWEDLEIVIFGRKALMPANLQEAVSEQIPVLETKIESFEDYEDALDHCKASVRCAIFLLVEDDVQPSIQQVFKNLSKPYLATGWPAFGVVVRNGLETVSAYKWMAQDSQIIDYVSADLFESKNLVGSFDEWWQKVVSKTEEALCPTSLKESLVAVANKTIAPQKLLFSERAALALLPRLNVSWKEAISVKLAPLVAAVKATNPEILLPHPALEKITSAVRDTYSLKSDVKSFLEDKNYSIAVRAGFLIEQLSESESPEALEAHLGQLLHGISPRSSGLLKQLNAVSKYLVDILSMSEAA